MPRLLVTAVCASSAAVLAATALAAATVALLLPVPGTAIPAPGQLSAGFGIHIMALGVGWLAIRSITEGRPLQAAATPARALVRGAVHDLSLARLAGRGGRAGGDV